MHTGKAEFVSHIFYIDDKYKYTTDASINLRNILLQNDTEFSISINTETFQDKLKSPNLQNSQHIQINCTLGEINVSVILKIRQNNVCLMLFWTTMYLFQAKI